MSTSRQLPPLQTLKVTTRIVIVNVTVLDLLGQLALPFPSLLRILQLQAMLVHGVAHGLDALVVQCQAGPDALVERLARLTGRVNVASHLSLHEALLVVDRSLNYPVADRLGHNILSRLLALQAETDADVAEGDARVG